MTNLEGGPWPKYLDFWVMIPEYLVLWVYVFFVRDLVLTIQYSGEVQAYFCPNTMYR